MTATREPLAGQTGRLRIDTAFGPPAGTLIEVVRRMPRRTPGKSHPPKVEVRTPDGRRGIVSIHAVEVR